MATVAPRIVITESEILDALSLAATGTGPSEARTVAELCVASGRCRASVERALQAIKREGRLVAHMVQREAISGHLKRVPAYTITPVKRKR